MKNSELLNIAPVFVQSLGGIKHMRLSFAVQKNAKKIATEEKQILETIRNMQSDELHELLVKATEKIKPAFEKLEEKTIEAYNDLLLEAIEATKPGDELLKEFDLYTKQKTEFLNDESDVQLHKVKLSALDDNMEIDAFQMELISHFLDEEN